METGKVRFFNEKKGYGFITAKENEELFFHISGVKDGLILNENDEIQFNRESDTKGDRAVDIEKI
ncbi:CspA family cold shock protein [Breznakia sp. PF5-3]|uniref:cold-shock protein n=1 Tax=unclassified Breznakia TaxID=2623764 RepID=UPI00240666E3|nr:MULTISPECIES: cold shock domain-containing protein [unclassified Breznakia]MDF9824515.1 CspA family cold shock protein [Breznakia sp. PM6-1]MDF9835301.1 CspA family cold shock protein [Breznakia sp. PF5-3]MDF9837017.1 CspA family cold shock protein [Breznakia sp. PFB2-8]MDF9858942.1 CspA family cold shock protein [Breznakia sp. PH5-24]